MVFAAHRYYVEFSKPDKLRPIPEGTVKVYFDITIGDGPDEYDIEFNFALSEHIDEKFSWEGKIERLRHKPPNDKICGELRNSVSLAL